MSVKYTTFAGDAARLMRKGFCLTNGGKMPTSQEEWNRSTRIMQSRFAGAGHQMSIMDCVGMTAFAAWYGFDNVPHVFIPPGFTAFLQSSARELTDDFLNYESLLDIGNHFFLHFPDGEAPDDGHFNPSRSSFFVQLCQLGKDGVRPIALHDRDDNYAWSKPGNAHHAPSVFKMIYGLSLYLAAFPESLIEFSPPDKEWKARRSLGLIVRAEATDDIEQSKSPHYRRGHFRVLSAERFKNRGSVVYVKGCFVGGKAYTLKAESP